SPSPLRTASPLRHRWSVTRPTRDVTRGRCRNAPVRADSLGTQPPLLPRRFTMTVRRAIAIGLASTAVTAAIVGGGLAWAGTDGGDLFAACAKNGKVIPGTLSVNETPSCTGGSTLVQWNETGPIGPTGPQGPQGLQGLQGE